MRLEEAVDVEARERLLRLAEQGDWLAVRRLFEIHDARTEAARPVRAFATRFHSRSGRA